MFNDKMDYIFAIAEEQNLTHAAKRLFIAQSTLTMYLNRLESELGMKLFDRSKSPILPTPAGQLYIKELKKIQEIEKNLVSKLHQMSHPEETFRIGIGPMRSLYWMPRLLPLFREIYPQVNIYLIEQGDETLPSKLRAGDVDMIIGTMSVGPDCTVVNLAMEEVLIIAPRAFNLVPAWALPQNSCYHPHEILPNQLQDLPLILPGPMNDLSAFSDQVLEHYGIQPKLLTSVSSMNTAAMLVANDMGYLFTSPVFLDPQNALLSSKIVYCTMANIPNTRKLVAAYSTGSEKEKMILQLLDLLRVKILSSQPGIHLV